MTTWRKRNQESFINKTPIREGAEFDIFNSNYWDKKDQFQLGDMKGDFVNIIKDIRSYITHPLSLLNETTDNVIFTFLSVFADKDPICNDTKIPTHNVPISISKPLYDQNLLWISESFRTMFKEGFEDSDADQANDDATSLINSNSDVVDQQAEDAAVYPNSNSEIGGANSEIGGVNSGIGGANSGIGGVNSGIGGSSNSPSANSYVIKNNIIYKIGGVKLPHNNLLDIASLQKLIIEFQQNHPDFIQDTDVYYSIKNKVATYYMKELSQYETKKFKNLDESGLFDFNNNIDMKLNDPIIQNAIQNIKLDITDPSQLAFSIDLDNLQSSMLTTYSDYSNNIPFLNQIAIYIVKNNLMNMLPTMNSALLPIINNISSPTDRSLLLPFKKPPSNPTISTQSDTTPPQNPCFNGFNQKTYNDLKNVTRLVKLQLINIVFIPMIILIIYNVYYFFFYQDCYTDNSTCDEYNEFPKLEEWVYEKLKITRENQPTFLYDWFFDLYFKPIKFIYTFFNSVKPTIVPWNNTFPYLFFMYLVVTLTPLIMHYRDDIINIISSVLFLELPKPDYVWYSSSIIWFSFILVLIQRIFGIGFDRGKQDGDIKLKPRLWSEWITEKMGSGAFTAIACGIFTFLYWVFKFLGTMSIISLSVYPIVIYILFVGLLGIWNNSSEGFNKKFEAKSGEKWSEINYFIFKKLLERMDENDNIIYSNIKGAAKNFLTIIILFLAEFMMIGILIVGIIQYKESSILSNYGNMRNVLCISSAVVIGLILGWCIMKYVTTYAKFFENIDRELMREKEAGIQGEGKPTLSPDKTFINIWKESLSMEDFQSIKDELSQSRENIKEAPGKIVNKGVNITKNIFETGKEIQKDTSETLKNIKNYFTK